MDGCLMSEDDLRIAILKELEISMQAVSPDFMLSPRQKPFSIDSERPLVDLIFYHRDMECLIPVYLKFGDVNTDEIEWMKLNLQILTKYTDEGGNNPIGIILCVLDNKQHVELVKLEQSKGFISKNLIDRPLKQIFKRKLKDAIRQARKQLASCEG
jgi:YhcG PDDEXK nuclease domain